MPTYEYHCAKCKKKFDHFQRISDPPLERCPRCGSAKPERLISAGAGLIFKGTGFYVTDYKKQKTEDGRQKTEKSKEPKTEKLKSGKVKDKE